MSSESKKTGKINIIDFIIKKKKMKQTDIAKELGVSRAQISKWKSGEDIPIKRMKSLSEMAGLFGDDFEWCLLVKTPENAESWIRFFSGYHDGYLDVTPCHLLSDAPEIYVPPILLLFDKVGIKIPEIAPRLYGEGDEGDEEDEGEDVDFRDLVHQYLESYAALINYNRQNIGELSDNDDVFENVLGIEYYIGDYALENVGRGILDKLGADHSIVAKVVSEARKNISKLIKEIVEIQIKNNRPIMKDYYNLLKNDPYDLADEELAGIYKGLTVDSSIESLLPLFERTVLGHVKLQTKLLEELHDKLDLLLKKLGYLIL
jgi:transcriptional regulator with XRE-family HTH domain